MTGPGISNVKHEGSNGVRIVYRMLFLLMFVVFAAPSSALAQGKLKKLVFEDCAAAKVEAATLAPEKITELCSYLSRVLTMQLGVSGELMPDAPPTGSPGAPIDTLHGTNLWNLFEPSREKEAKQCALDLLVEKGDACAVILPELLPLLDRPLLSSDLGAGLEAAIWKVTLAVKASGAALDPKWYFTLLSYAGNDDYGFMASNILMELHERSLPHLMSALTSTDSRRREAAQSVLFRVDREGDVVGAGLLTLLESGDDDVRMKAVKLLARLPKTYPESVPRLLGRLGDPSPTVQSAVYEALDRILQTPQLPAIPRNETQSDLLIRAFEKGPVEHRPVLERALRVLLDPSPASLDRLTGLAHSADDDLRERSLRILAPAVSTQPSLLPLYYEALYDRVPAVRLVALNVIASDSAKAEEKANALLKMLKSNSSERDLAGKTLLLSAAAVAVRSLPITPTTVRMTPYFVEALALRADPSSSGTARELPGADSEAAKTLVHMGKEVVPPVSKALRDQDALVRRRAVYVLSRITPVERATAKLLVFMLRDADPGVRKEAEDAVRALGGEIVPEVRKGLTWKEPEGQLAAAQVLLALGERDAEVERVFRDGFSRASCGEKLALVKSLVSLGGDYREKVQPFLVDCALDDGNDQVAVFDALLGLTPLKESVVEQLAKLLKERRLPRVVQLQLLERAGRLGVPPVGVVEVLREMLKEKDNAVRKLLLGLVPDLGEAGKSALPELKAIVESREEEAILRDKAALAIATLAPEAIDWQRFFLKELEGETPQWAASAVAQLDSDKAIPLLDRALKELPVDRKEVVLGIIAKLGERAAPLRDDLLKLLADGDPTLRYRAFVALLHVEPANVELLPALRRELIGRYGFEIDPKDISPAIEPLLQTILAAPTSFVERRAAESLLERMKREGSGV